jgi:hypothetical protein
MLKNLALSMLAAVSLVATSARADDDEGTAPAEQQEQSEQPAPKRRGKHKASTPHEQDLVKKARAGKAGKHKATTQKEKELVAKAKLKAGKGKQINPRLKGKGHKVDESAAPAPAADAE